MIEVKVFSKTPISSIKERNLKKAAEFYSNLLIPEFTENLSILIDLVDEEVNVCHKIIDGFYHIMLGKSNPIYTLAHEMVHVKQFETGQMSIIKRDNVYYRLWMGEEFAISENYIDDEIMSPWEVEAYGKEIGLYHFWKKRNKNEV
jgi:hypothetical protein